MQRGEKEEAEAAVHGELVIRHAQSRLAGRYLEKNTIVLTGKEARLP